MALWYDTICYVINSQMNSSSGGGGKGTYVPISPIISACRFPGGNGPWNAPDRSAGRGKVKEGLDNRYNSGGDSSNDSGKRLECLHNIAFSLYPSSSPSRTPSASLFWFVVW